MVIVNAAEHAVSPANSYLFDTNVWLYIFGPVAGSSNRKQSRYAKLLRDIIDRKASVFVSSLVLAEYINAVLRMGFRKWKRTTDNVNADFKTDYRVTEDYEAVLRDAIFQVEEILKVAQKKPDDFHRIEITDALARMGREADYNDMYLVKTCEECNGLKFVSDDTDIKSIQANITLITAS